MEENRTNRDPELLRQRRRKLQQKKRMLRRKRQRQLILAVSALVIVLLLIAAIASLVRSGNDDPSTQPSGNQPTGKPSQSDSTDPPTEAALPLTVLTPNQNRYATMDETVMLVGTSDPKDALTLNGEAVERDESGMFSLELPLALGENRFTLVHRETTLEYSITRLNAVKSFYPVEEMTYCSEASVLFEVVAKKGSQVTADFRGQTISLGLCADQLGSGAGEGYCVYEGKYVLPSLDADQELGTITYTVTHEGVTDTYTSGMIKGLKSVPILDSDPTVTPTGGSYIDVGSGFIVEVVSKTAETLDGRTDDDNSSPLRNYLPKGTVDYASTVLVHNAKAEQTYRVLRCGRRVYEAKRNYPAEQRDPIIMTYNGTLPDHNEVGFASITEQGNQTVLTLDTMWKAPFYFDVAPQEYTDPANRKFTFAELTVTHIDITFCYATKFTGPVVIPENHPLFSGAEVIQNTSDCTLRLFLRQTGGYYGWDAYYNEKDQLCFQFLKPATVKKADNAYGADLTGVKIMIDVGHGGADSGTMGTTGGTKYSEASRNLALSKALQAELESMGASVYPNRVGNEPVTIEERLAYLKEISPDYCIAIHQNASVDTSVRGFEAFYYGPMSQKAAVKLWEAHRDSGVYTSRALMWHYYHLARQSICPVVLTENGYMSNDKDMAATVDQAAIAKKAKLLAQGIADYFLDITP